MDKNFQMDSHKFYQYFLEQKYTDTNLIANESKKIIKCHKLFLIAASKYFEDVFNVIGESDRNPTIVMKDISHEFFMKMLEYIYLGKISLIDNDVPEFEQAAKYLKIDIKNIHVIEDNLSDVTLVSQMSEMDDITLNTEESIQDCTMNSTLFSTQEIRSQQIKLRKSKTLFEEPEIKKPKLSEENLIHEVHHIKIRRND